MAALFFWLAGALLLATAQVANAHGGGMHRGGWEAPGYSNVTRILLATATNFSFYDASLSPFVPGDIPFFPSYASPATAVGSVSVYEFLDGSCRETAALYANLTITAANKQPVAYEKVYLWGMTGRCFSGVKDTYKHNVTLGNSKINMLWASSEDDSTDANGVLVGLAPNMFFPRSTASAEGPALTSILIAFAPDVSPFLCAELAWNNVDMAAWAQKVKTCQPSSDFPDLRRRVLRSSRRVLSGQ